MNSLERIRKVIYFVRKLQTVGRADSSENGYRSASCIRQVSTQDAYVTFVFGKCTLKNNHGRFKCRQQTMTEQWNHPTDYALKVLSAVKFMQQKRLVLAPELLW